MKMWGVFLLWTIYPMPNGDGAEQWIKPGLNTIKINVDASIFERGACFGYAVVVRDDNDFLVEAIPSIFRELCHLLYLRLLALKRHLVAHQGNRVEIESDSLTSISAGYSEFSQHVLGLWAGDSRM